MLQFADPFGNNYVSLRKESRFFWRSFFQLRATCQQYLVFLFLCALFKTSNRPQPITYFSRLSLSGFFCILLLVLHEFVIFFILVYMLIYIFLILFNYSFTLFSKSHFWTALALLWWLVKNHHLTFTSSPSHSFSKPYSLSKSYSEPISTTSGNRTSSPGPTIWPVML